jgi:hypothetical protein
MTNGEILFEKIGAAKQIFNQIESSTELLDVSFTPISLGKFAVTVYEIETGFCLDSFVFQVVKPIVVAEVETKFTFAENLMFMKATSRFDKVFT